jgi:hypothetical protein
VTTSDWELSEFGHAYRKWRLATQPEPGVTALVKKWARRVTCNGPSTAAAPISDTGEDFMDWVDHTNVFVTYVVSHRDRHIIVKEISP